MRDEFGRGRVRFDVLESYGNALDNRLKPSFAEKLTRIHSFEIEGVYYCFRSELVAVLRGSIFDPAQVLSVVDNVFKDVGTFVQEEGPEVEEDGFDVVESEHDDNESSEDN